MVTTPVTYTGKDAAFKISGLTHTALGMGEFSLTLDRGTVEQPLVAEEGNMFLAGSLSVDGSFGSAKITTGGVGAIVASLLHSKPIKVSGSCGTDSLHFHFKSAQVTGFDIDMGNADTISEGSLDFTLVHPYKVSSISYATGGAVWITDY